MTALTSLSGAAIKTTKKEREKSNQMRLLVESANLS